MSEKGRVYGIKSTTAAYNTKTKEAFIYIESEQVSTKTIKENIQSVGVTSIFFNTFSNGNWEIESSEALSNIKSCKRKEDFLLIESGSKPLAYDQIHSNHYSSSSNQGIYVLRLDNNKPTPCFYVGKATNITQRIQQHEAGTGAFCISGEPFTRVESLTKGERLFFVGWITK